MKLLRKIGFIIATILFLLFTVGPIIWEFIMSIQPDGALFIPTSKLLPEDITWANYSFLFSGSRRSAAFFTGMKNSATAVLVTLTIGMPVSLITAYVLSKMKFPGRAFFKNALLVTMVIPVMATIIPLYRMFSVGHMLNNMFWLCVVYVSSYLPMATWMISNYFSTIPAEIEDAARIDGCDGFAIFIKIILPLSVPVIISVALIMFLNTWGQFQIPLILASSTDTKPMAIVISEFVTRDTTAYGNIAAAGIIAIIPPAVTAVIFRKYLMSGMIKGSGK